MTYRDDVLATSGLVAYWPLDEPSGTTAADLLGSKDGTTTGATPGATGIVTNTGDTAYAWDANSDIVSMGSDAAFRTADFSIEFWFTWTSWAGGRALVAHRLTADGQGGWVVMADGTSGLYSFFVHRTASSWLAVNATGWAVDTVYHAVFSFDGAFQYVYRNGALVTQQAVGEELSQPSSLILSVGAAHGVSASSHRGSIADVALYDVALDASTILAHYEAGIAEPYVEPPPEPPEPLTLPTPGADNDTWGDELNAWLEAKHAGVYNVLSYGAVGDGVADDTDAIQDAIDAAIAAGGGIVDGSGQRYKLSLNATLTHSNYKYALMVYGDGVMLRNMTLISDEEYVNGQVWVYVSGQAKGAASFATADIVQGDINFYPDVYLPIYPISPADYLDASITLTTPGDAANFAVGDYIYIRTGQTNPVAFEAQPDAEINRVTSISGGVLGLAYPLAKAYVQKYFPDAGRDDVATTSVTAYPAFLGVVNANDYIIRGFTAENVHLEISADAYPGVAFPMSQVVDARITNCTGTLKNTCFQSWGPHRFLTVEKCSADAHQTLLVDTWVSGDRGCGNMLVDGCNFSAWGTYGELIHMNEGCHDVRIRASSFSNATAFDASLALYTTSGGGYRHSLTDCTFNGEGAGALVKFNDVDGAFIDGCDLSRADGGYSLSFQDCQNISLGVNQFGNGLVALHPHTTAGVAEVTPRVMSRWVYYNSAASSVVGTVPGYATIIDMQVYVYITFNGTTPTLKIGSLGVWDEQYVDSPVSLATQGFVTVVKKPYTYALDATPHTVYAALSAGGSSAGRAQVIVTYINGPTT